jgi:adenylylsulfate kinase
VPAGTRPSLAHPASPGFTARVASEPRDIVRQHSRVAAEERSSLLGQRGCVVWLTGLSGSGKSTVAYAFERALVDAGRLAFVLDGDNLRHGLCADLGFSAEDRSENVRRAACAAGLLADAGVVVVGALISPYRSDRAQARDQAGAERFLEVFVDAPLEVCEGRDPKGLYKKARSGAIPRFTGISDPYEAPESPDLRLPTAEQALGRSIADLEGLLRGRGFLPEA